MGVLSEAQVRTARPLDKAYKLYDGRGLYLRVSTSGARLWRFKYHFGGKERLLALGMYPDVSLKRACEKRDEARRLLAETAARYLPVCESGLNRSSARNVARSFPMIEARNMMSGYP